MPNAQVVKKPYDTQSPFLQSLTLHERAKGSVVGAPKYDMLTLAMELADGSGRARTCSFTARHLFEVEGDTAIDVHHSVLFIFQVFDAGFIKHATRRITPVGHSVASP
jgi:hypothetical protein